MQFFDSFYDTLNNILYYVFIVDSLCANTFLFFYTTPTEHLNNALQTYM